MAGKNIMIILKKRYESQNKAQQNHVYILWGILPENLCFVLAFL